MGYKLAGYDVVAANDIDPQMRLHYETNLKPKLFIEGPVTEVAKQKMPAYAQDLDVLDGSPPCSSFSMVGKRDKLWGKEKHFREGQAVQVLDDLFFDFLSVAEALRPKVVIAENVRGMLAGKAKGYVTLVFEYLKEIGYEPQVFMIDAAFCGVPQIRKRVFICAQRRDLKRPRLTIETDDYFLRVGDCLEGISVSEELRQSLALKGHLLTLWEKSLPGHYFKESQKRLVGNLNYFGSCRLHPREPSHTLTATRNTICHWSEPRYLSFAEFKRIGSFPDDYWAESDVIGRYVVGMSVPPLLMKRVAGAVRDQWLS